MATQVQNRRGTTAEHSTFTGAVGEVTIDTDKDTVVVHDGATAGGRPLLREDGSNSALALGSAATPSLKFTGDTNTGIYSPGADQLALSTNGTGRLFVGSAGLVGIGTTSPTEKLEVDGKLKVNASTGPAEIFLSQTGTTNGLISGAGGPGADLSIQAGRFTYIGSVNSTIFSSIASIGGSATERARIDNSGRLLVGTSTSTATGGEQGGFQVAHASGSSASFTRYFVAAAAGPIIDFGRSRGALGVQTPVINNDNLGRIRFSGSNGTDLSNTAAEIKSEVDGDPFTTGDLTDLPGRLVFSTTPDGSASPVERMRITSGGNIGIDTNTFTAATAGRRVLELNGLSSCLINLDVAGTRRAYLYTDGLDTNLNNTQAGDLIFSTSNNERARIDSTGKLLVGTSSTFVGTIQAVTGTGGSIGISRNSASVTAGQIIGLIQFAGNGGDGVTVENVADIRCVADGTHAVGDKPGRLVFSTTSAGASSPTERMRITSDGVVLIGKTADDINTQGARIDRLGVGSFAKDSGIALFVNRGTDDGALVVFRQAGVDEGNISVSGTTVSYNGAHLSRWSQLPSSQERTDILRGSVLSNIDEMCEWGDEENEQLNRMKVSDVEGDKNVSGVFQAWDDDDDTYVNDFYCAMTGDFIIRIAAGVTVERGDLLMSAGDGTAKPQDDDIIRSKTIAKVTSTNVSCTYEDGSYCVPCVLMAC